MASIGVTPLKVYWRRDLHQHNAEQKELVRLQYRTQAISESSIIDQSPGNVDLLEPQQQRRRGGIKVRK